MPIDELWLHVMFAAIGGTFESEKFMEVISVVVNVRKAYFRSGVWTKTSGGKRDSGKEGLVEIGKRFKELLKLDEKQSIGFPGHTESACSGGAGPANNGSCRLLKLSREKHLAN